MPKKLLSPQQKSAGESCCFCCPLISRKYEDYAVPRKKEKYTPVQITDGEWYRSAGYTHTECCDCALVHKEEMQLVNGHLEFRVTVDQKKTKQRRKELGIFVTRRGNANE
jgi:hypothetical protein